MYFSREQNVMPSSFGLQSGTNDTSLLTCTTSTPANQLAMSRAGNVTPRSSISFAVKRVIAVTPVIATVVSASGSRFFTFAATSRHSGTSSASVVNGWWPSIVTTFQCGTSSSTGTIAQCFASTAGAEGSPAAVPSAASAVRVAALAVIASLCVPRHIAVSSAVVTSSVGDSSGATRA